MHHNEPHLARDDLSLANRSASILRSCKMPLLIQDAMITISIGLFTTEGNWLYSKESKFCLTLLLWTAGQQSGTIDLYTSANKKDKREKKPEEYQVTN